MDPVSWLQITQGWSVVDSDGKPLGVVAQVEGDKQADIFDGLAIRLAHGQALRYLPAEQVAEVLPGEVRLSVAVADPTLLAPFTPPPSEARWTLGAPSLGARFFAWFRGGRGGSSIHTIDIGSGQDVTPRPGRMFGPRTSGPGRALGGQARALTVLFVVVVVVIVVLEARH